ncbi:MAG: ABC transporter ATP-binding protein, partial [Paracoccaceae bacterium]|nr:ABC transporter ATP-binding protein [Paracoccaceae bacterium]
MAGIKLRQVTKKYGSLNVLNSIDLDVADGEFLTLVGPSGCGKSTTLRIIAGLETQTTGDVEIDGALVNEVRPSLRDLAMVFQSYALYPHLTVQQNLMTPLRLRDLDFWERLPLLGYLVPGRAGKMAKIKEEVHNVAAVLKIEPLLNRKPGQLSGGQRQRVALGRAMVRNPAAFLMDEPLSNLDASLRVHMRAELSELHRDLQSTFIYVTHDQAEALTMSDRIAVMMDGDLLQLGPPDEVYQNPNDIRVAEFIGSPKMNILPGEADVTGKVMCLGFELDQTLELATPGPVSVGLRPEHLTLQPTGTAECFSGTLSYKENLGSDVFLHLETEGCEQKVVLRVKPTEADYAQLGQTI